MCWGESNSGGDCAGLDLTGTVAVYSTDRAFAAQKADGSFVCWGSSSRGGNCAESDVETVAVYSTNLAFAAHGTRCATPTVKDATMCSATSRY